MSAKAASISIIALTGAVAIWIAWQWQIQWLGIVGLFVAALGDAVLFGESLSNHKNYEDIPIHVIVISFMIMIVTVVLKLPNIWIVSVMASYGIVGVTSWFLTERSYRGELM